MRNLISIILAAVCIFTLTACGSNDIKATKELFPEFEGKDFEGKAVNNDIFKDYDATIVNFWTNSCGICIAEMPELEDYFRDFKDKNINLIAIAASAGDSDAFRADAAAILKEKGVTYTNIIPDSQSSFYNDFICEITGFPTTYIVDSKGNIVGAPIVGVVKNQEDVLMKRLKQITN